MATILIIMLMGMALTVTVMGVMYSVRTSQKQQVTVHAATHSQAGVWAAAQAVRLYLEELDTPELETLDTANPLTFTINDNVVTATFTSNDMAKSSSLERHEDESSLPYHLRSIISYTDAAAKSSSTLEVVYVIPPAGSTDNGTSPSTQTHEIYINKGLNLSGEAKLRVDKNTILNVSGVLNFGQSKIKEINTIRAISNITIDQKSKIKELHSNGIITISGDGAEVGSANAVGAMTISGDKVKVGNANAVGAMVISGDKIIIGSASAGGAMAISGADAQIDSANAAGAMPISGVQAIVGRANAGGAMAISGAGTHIDSADAGGAMAISGAQSIIGSANAVGAMAISGAGTQIDSADAVGAMVITDAKVGSANAIGAIAITNSTVSSANSGGAMPITNSTVGYANAVGAIAISGSNVDYANSGGAIAISGAHVISANAVGAMAIDATSTVKHSQGLNLNTLVQVPVPAPVSAPIITPVSIITITPPRVDAYKLKDAANYIFSYQNEQMRVAVKNINNIPDSPTAQDYYLDKLGNLCTVLNDKKCNDSLFRICENKDKKCIEYDSYNKTWGLKGDDDNKNPVFATGILWFQGNLTLEEGSYRNSMIATGSIKIDEDSTVYAANYNGYKKTCKSNNFYPTNLCGTKNLKSNPIGSIALLAGGYVNGAFTGGTITLNDDTKILGSVIAGDTIIFKGEVDIKGYISTAGQGAGAVQNWTGKVTIDVTNLPDNTYTGETPSINGEDASTSEGDGPEGPSGSDGVTILWSRYL